VGNDFVGAVLAKAGDQNIQLEDCYN